MSTAIRTCSLSCIRKTCYAASRCWFVVALLTMAVPSFVQSTTEQPPTELRELWGTEYADAQKAVDTADRLRAAFETRYSWHPSSQLKPSSEEAKQDAEKVMAAYAEVAASYPHTDIAACSSTRLAGFYQYLGQTAKAIDTAKEVASTYEHTQYASKAAFEVGLLYLQAAHNPTAAIEWFKKIPAPKDGPIDTDKEYNAAAKLHLAAQQQIARSAMTMGRRDVARGVFSRLQERYPKYRKAFVREMDVQDDTALHPALGMVDEMIAQRMAEIGKIVMPTTPESHTVQTPLPSVPELNAGVVVDTASAHLHEGSSFKYWAGWCLLVVGAIVSASGILYRVRTLHRKGA